MEKPWAAKVKESVKAIWPQQKQYSCAFGDRLDSMKICKKQSSICLKFRWAEHWDCQQGLKWMRRIKKNLILDFDLWFPVLKLFTPHFCSSFPRINLERPLSEQPWKFRKFLYRRSLIIFRLFLRRSFFTFFQFLFSSPFEIFKN